jgi:very-long-chain enoyl-CoA reductase
MIGVFYALNTALISTYAISSGSNDPGWLIIGYLMFCVGSLGNLYHHFLLANLRTGTKGERRYQPPRGGLFKYVATPHYFFELVAWLGIACVAQQVNAFLVFANMLAYLLARAKNTNDFYRSKFDSKEWPLSRKALVPYLT